MTPLFASRAAPLPERLAALEPLRALFHAKRWRELMEAIDSPFIWAFDRPLSAAECVRLLEQVFEPAQDLKLLVLDAVQRARAGGRSQHAGRGELRQSFRCCVLWGEAEEFVDHEFEFDLHLGSSVDGERRFRVLYLGFSARG